jgi:hypothetical protein
MRLTKPNWLADRSAERRALAEYRRARRRLRALKNARSATPQADGPGCDNRVVLDMTSRSPGSVECE